MNMQFYDHSGETHVRTRASYVPRPGRTSPGLIREESYEHTETRGERAPSTADLCVVYIAQPGFLCHERKFSKFISLRIRERAPLVHSQCRRIRLFRRGTANVEEFGSPGGGGKSAPSSAFAVNYPRNCKHGTHAEFLSSAEFLPDFPCAPEAAWMLFGNVRSRRCASFKLIIFNDARSSESTAIGRRLLQMHYSLVREVHRDDAGSKSKRMILLPRWA